MLQDLKDQVNDLIGDGERNGVTEIRIRVGVEAVISTVLERQDIERKDRGQKGGSGLHKGRSRNERETWDQDRLDQKLKVESLTLFEAWIVERKRW